MTAAAGLDYTPPPPSSNELELIAAVSRLEAVISRLTRDVERLEVTVRELELYVARTQAAESVEHRRATIGGAAAGGIAGGAGGTLVALLRSILGA